MKLKELPESILKSFKFRFASAEMLKVKSGNELPVIVSLTTIPSRFEKVHITVRSILSQHPKPQKIVLWINEDHKGSIPLSLEELQGDIFEIHFSHLHSSHKKLIHSLKKYPEFPIVTCDDDCIYRKGWLYSLYETHLKYPGHIIAHRVRCIKKDAHNNYLPYKQWIWSGNEHPKSLMAIGAEGVLYPPKIFPDTVFDEKLFLKLTPTADDLWFKSMALIQGVNYMKAENSPKGSIPLMGTQKISLKKENIGQDKNRAQWEELADYFNLSTD